MTNSARACLPASFAILAFACLTDARAHAATNPVWQAGDGFRSAALSVLTGGQAGFTLLKPDDTGITFSNKLSDATVATNRLYEIGSGVALGDVDGDSWVDIYFCRLEGDNALYRNLGHWRFEDITARAGVACTGQFSTGCALADLDGDGDLDLLVNSLGAGTRLFLNDGKGHFAERTDSGLLRRFGATSLALADVDGDGDLDLYVTNYRTDTIHDSPPGLKLRVVRQADGTEIIEPRDRFLGLKKPGGGLTAVENGEPDLLYLNRENGRFMPAPWHVGVFLGEDGLALPAPPTDWGLTVMFRDFNGDGLPDLYVCNDFVFWPDRLWLNQNGRRFQAAPRQTFRCISLASMAGDVADINRDGFNDLFVADMLSPRREHRAWQRPDTLKDTLTWPVGDPNFRPEVPRNTLQLARGDGTFAEIAQLAGVAATDWTWSAVFLDVDLDGWEDLLVATGSNHDVQDTDVMARIAQSGGWKTPQQRLQEWAQLPHRHTPGIALRNRHDLSFEDVSAAWGFNTVGVAQGIALAELDNDGDLDVVINCLNAPARIYRNNSSAPRIAVRLRGAGANTRGIGARINVTGGPVTQTQEIIAGGRYLSSDDPMRVFAAGNAQQLAIEVTWRTGKRSLVKDARPNHLYEIAETGAIIAPEPAAPPLIPLFEDLSARLNHVHRDEPFDDFACQPLLPHRLSTLGPGLAWADVDGDSFDELLIGGGKGGRLAVFRNDGQGGFTPWAGALLPAANPRDQTGVLLWRGAHAVVRALVGESNREDSNTNAPPLGVFSFQANVPALRPPALGNGRSATGPLALADVDGDGNLDLFVGGRVTAGRYPEPATSYLLRYDYDTFTVAQTFPELGLVSGAVFTDFDGDGAPDLALACEWGPIRVFRNDKGRFTPWNLALDWSWTPPPHPPSLLAHPSTLNQLTGWWNGIATGDFDGDGRLDLVASNWGRNWRTDQPPGTRLPVTLYYGDFDGDGIVQTLLASADPWLGKITPWRERKAITAAMPAVAEHLPDHHTYGRASVAEVLDDRATAAHVLEATTTDSMAFLNRGDHFEARPLPVEAQFAPAFGVCVADFDGDGNQDLFLAQNFFGMDAETSRQDAGTGLVLLGDGRGGFRALGPLETGIAIYGEQRGCAVADFDGDGRVDLAVAQHAGPTRLFRNRRGTPGVRVALGGPADNPTAVGAVVRLRFDERSSPAQGVHAGGGYWSQDSATLVFATPSAPRGVQVRWPGGQTQDWPWPAGARLVDVSTAGVRPRSLRAGNP